MAYDDVEAELRTHPRVADAVVTRIRTRQRKKMLVAYVVATGPVEPAAIRGFLAAPRLRSSRIPEAVILVDSMPRTSAGEVDRHGLPLPVLPGAAAGGKSAMADIETPVAVGFFLTGVFAFAAFLLTDVFWPGSTDLSVVPQPWAGLFTGLYVAEFLSFGLGIAFLFVGRRWLTGLGRSPVLTTLAHLAIFWLLASWWPQDNFYRLAAKTDWARQAALVYGFNITLMIAGAVLVAFVVRERRVD